MIKLNIEEFDKLQMASKMSNKPISDCIGVSNSTIWRIKNNKMLPGNEFISAVLKTFSDKKFEDLFFIV